MLTLYALPQSPFCAKVRGALRYKKIKFEEVEPHGGSYQTTDYQEIIVAGSVPAIQVDEWVLHDSQAIIEYLEEAFPSPSVWSEDVKQRAEQRALVNYHDSKLEPAVRELVPLARQPDSNDKEQHINLAKDRLFDRLYRLNRIVASELIQLNSPLCVADWVYPPTLYMALDLLDHMGHNLRLPDLVRIWMDRSMQNSIVEAETVRLRGAIAQWLIQGIERAN
ncbi:MAG: glutathione S-transferase family protein [bacterium]